MKGVHVEAKDSQNSGEPDQGRSTGGASAGTPGDRTADPLHDRTTAIKGVETSSSAPTAASPTRESWVGRSLGKYDVTGLLGAGGMGIVYRAHDPKIERDVAIKLLPRALAENPTVCNRFLSEARTAGKLTHPNVVSIYDIVEFENTHFIVMELVQGGSAAERLKQRGALTVVDATRFIAEACKGMAAAHAVGLVHRDIKPGNLLLTPDETVKVADFGLAKPQIETGGEQLTQDGEVLGTPCFMSPEQCQALPVDARSDIYSLGATYYTLLTGAYPHATVGSAVQIMFAHVRGDSIDPRKVNPNLPESCANIVARATALDPEDRYQTADEMRADLEAVLEDVAASEHVTGSAVGEAKKSSVRPPAPSRPAKPASTPTSPDHDHWLARHRWPVIVTAALALVAAVAAATYFLPPGETSTPHAAPTRPSSPAASLVRGVTADTIRLGTTTAYSGGSRDLGRNMVAGMRACFEAVNAEGGIHGRKIELVVLDDGYEPDRALANMRELYEDREAFAIIGNVGTPTAKFTAPFAIEHRWLFFAPMTGAAFLRHDPPDRYVFNYRASYADETEAIVKYFVEVLEIPADKIAVFAQNDSYGDDGFRGVTRALRKYGIREQDVLRASYERNSTNVADAVELVDKNRDRIGAVVMVSTYAPTSRFVQKVRDLGVDAKFAALSFVGSDALAEDFRELGPQRGAGVIVTQVVPHYRSNSTGVIRYREVLAQYMPEAHPEFVSLEGYIAGQCLVEGLKKAGPDLTTEKLIDALESIRDLDLGIGPIISFGPSRHQASNKVWGTILDDSTEYQVLDLEHP